MTPTTKEQYIELLTAASDSYYNSDKSLMTDPEFDRLRDEFEAKWPSDPFLKVVGSQMISGVKVKHSIAMGSQLKVVSPEELEKWSENVKEKVGESSFNISEKLDGLSLSVIYKNGKLFQAVTRGDGEIGEDVTANAKKIPNLPKTISLSSEVTVRGEILISKKTYEDFFSDKANPRNAASGTIRRLDGERSELLHFLAYDIICEEHFSLESQKFESLKKLGFSLPEYKVLSSTKEVVELWKAYQKEKRENSLFELDGLIVSVNDISKQDELGIIDQRPRYSRAFKFPSESAETILNEVEWSVGRTGKITPVGKVSPVKVMGVTISNVTLHNLSEMRRLSLRLGQKVQIERAGDVIPKIIKALDEGKNDIIVPDHCPVCAEKTISEEIFLVCPNLLCDAQVSGNLLNWIKTVEVKGFGDELVDRLYKMGRIKEPSDFYTISPEELAALDRMGEKSAAKVLKNLHDKKTLSLPVFIDGLSILNVAAKTIELLEEKYPSLELLSSESPENLMKVHGIGEITAKAIHEGLKQREGVIKNLLQHISIKEKVKITEGKVLGLKFCFTGFRDKELEEMIVSQGGKMASGVSKNLNYLICKDKEDGSSSKLTEAKKLSISILTPDELKTLLS